MCVISISVLGDELLCVRGKTRRRSLRNFNTIKWCCWIRTETVQYNKGCIFEGLCEWLGIISNWVSSGLHYELEEKNLLLFKSLLSSFPSPFKKKYDYIFTFIPLKIKMLIISFFFQALPLPNLMVSFPLCFISYVLCFLCETKLFFYCSWISENVYISFCMSEYLVIFVILKGQLLVHDLYDIWW